MRSAETKQRDRMFLKLFLKSAPDQVTEEEVAYFREHPEQIDQVTAPGSSIARGRCGSGGSWPASAASRL